ncbi:hypothetical protein HRbin14_01056 [bacterium HR14]|nr:hypothetical protein HRbin14_01056 [bacterium HR14]
MQRHGVVDEGVDTLLPQKVLEPIATISRYTHCVLMVNMIGIWSLAGCFNSVYLTEQGVIAGGNLTATRVPLIQITQFDS